MGAAGALQEQVQHPRDRCVVGGQGTVRRLLETADGCVCIRRVRRTRPVPRRLARYVTMGFLHDRDTDARSLVPRAEVDRSVACAPLRRRAVRPCGPRGCDPSHAHRVTVGLMRRDALFYEESWSGAWPTPAACMDAHQSRPSMPSRVEMNRSPVSAHSSGLKGGLSAPVPAPMNPIGSVDSSARIRRTCPSIDRTLNRSAAASERSVCRRS